MKKLRKSKLVLSLCLVAAMITLMAVPAFAGSAAQTIGGYTLTGSVSMGSRSATASSSFGTDAGVSVDLTYKYACGFDGQETIKTVSAHDSGIRYCSVMASASPSDTVNVESHSARASHFASYNGMTASFTTSA